MANGNSVQDTVTVTIKQKGAIKTLKAINGLTRSIEDAELASIELSSTMDEVFDTRQLAAYQQRLSSIRDTLDDMGNALTTNQFDTIAGHLRQIQVNTRGASEAGQDLADSSILSSRYAEQTADSVQDISRHGHAAAEAAEAEARARRLAAIAAADLARIESRARREEEASRRRTRRAESAAAAGGGGGRNGGRNMSKLLSSAGGLAAMYGLIAANVYAASESFRVLSQAASDSRLLEVSETLSASKGVSVAVSAEDMRGILDDAISIQESMKLATAAVAKGFTTTQLEDLTIVARRASVALGVDLTDAMNRVTKGIAKQEVELLDELGITIKLDEAFSKYAKNLGVATDDLSSFQRQQALTNYVLEKSEETLGSIDEVMKATEWEKFGANISTVINKSLQFLTKEGSTAARVIAVLNDTMRDADDIKGYADRINQLQVTAEMAKEGTDLVAAFASGWEVFSASSTRAIVTASMKQQKAFDMLIAKRDILLKERGDPGLFSNRMLDDRMILLNQEIRVMNNQVDTAEASLREMRKLVKESQGLVIPDQQQLPTAGVFGDVDLNRASEIHGTFQSFEKAGLTLKETSDKAFKSINKSATASLDAVIAETQVFLDLVADVKQAGIDTGNNTDSIISQKLGDSGFDSIESIQKKNAEGIKYKKTLEDISKVQIDGAQFLAVREASTAVLRKNSFTLEEKSLSNLYAEQSANADMFAAKKAFLGLNSISSKETTAQSLKEISFQNQINQLLNNQLIVKQSVLATSLEDAHSLQVRLGNVDKLKSAEFAIAQAQQEVANATVNLNASNSNSAKATLTTAQEALRIAQAAKEELPADAATTTEGQAIAFGGGTIGTGTALGGADAGAGDLEAQTESLAASNLGKAADSMGSLTAHTPGLTAMSSALADLATVSLTFGTSMESGLSMATAGLQAMGGMMANVSDTAITEIDHQIALEKKRDGSSEKSLAKIKQLETEKIKEQQKSAKQQIIISTAVATMNALAVSPFPLGIAMAATAVIAGGLALNQANTAASNSLESLNTTPDTSSVSSISIGERDNSIDLSSSANAGEYAYVTGADGTGSANNFTARASGGTAKANTNLLVGEDGPEMVSFAQDAEITSNENALARNSGGSTTHVTIQTMDAQSFLDKSEDIFNAFTHQAEQQGMDMDSLRN